MNSITRATPLFSTLITGTEGEELIRFELPADKD